MDAHDPAISGDRSSGGGDINYGIGAFLPGGKTSTQLHQEWFDHWLKGEPATEAHESGVLLYIMGANEWRAEADWPLKRAEDTPLYLGLESRLAWQAPESDFAESTFVYDPATPVPTVGGSHFMTSEFPPGPLDQREVESRDDVLVFTSAPLEADTEITGRVRAVLHASTDGPSTDGPSTDWVARMCVVDPDDLSRNIVDGIKRVHTAPGRVDEVEIDMWSTAVVVREGHRLGVQVTSSCFPRWDRNLNAGEPVTTATTMRTANQRVLHDADHPSRIVLPVVPRPGKA